MPSWRPVLLLLALIALLVAAPAADAAKRRAPNGFYGMNWDSALEGKLPVLLGQQWDTMAGSGVESVRTVFSWAATQPNRNQPPRFNKLDAIVSRAASRRIQLLPIVFEAPPWAELRPGVRHSPPARPWEYGAFLHALAARYGSRGTFWNQHPELPRRPVRYWQIWNEAHLRFYWNVPDGWEMSWPSGYVSLLRAARPALRSADPKARVVLGGMSGESWSHLRELYNAGARKLFDVAAIHPHSSSVKDALITARLTRKVMRRARDKRKPLWITELGWPAARGKQPADEGLQRLTTTPSGMAARMKKIYGKLVRTRKSKKYGVSRVFWFTWATGYKPSTETGIWDFAGLVWSAGPAFILTPALKVYRGSARRYQGCAKTILGRCAH